VMRRAVAPATLLGTGAGKAYVAPASVPLRLEGTPLVLRTAITPPVWRGEHHVSYM